MMTGVNPTRDKAAIVGVGLTELSPLHERTSLSRAVGAFKNALADAGVFKTDLDGLICPEYGTDYDRFFEVLALDVEHTYQNWIHGRFQSPRIHHTGVANPPEVPILRRDCSQPAVEIVCHFRPECGYRHVSDTQVNQFANVFTDSIVLAS